MSASSAVFSVIFPGNICFLNDFISSLNNQTHSDFEIVIANDGLLDAEQYLKELRFGYRVINVSGTPNEIRETCINQLIDWNYDIVVFADSDDIQSSNRVEVSLQLLDHYPIVCNDLDIIDNRGILLTKNYWKERLGQTFVFDKTFILNKNILGLGNSAIRMDIFRSKIKIPSEVIAPDWYLFYLIFSRGKAIFNTDCTTLYRQHDANITGLKQVDETRLRHIIQTKKKHYLALSRQEESVKYLMEQIEKVENHIQNEPDIIDYYLELLNRKMLHYFWWEETNYLL